jgi:hypothetical protein
LHPSVCIINVSNDIVDSVVDSYQIDRTNNVAEAALTKLLVQKFAPFADLQHINADLYR